MTPSIKTIYKDHESALKCLRSVARHHGKIISLQDLRSKDKTGKEPASLRSIAEIAESFGLRARCVEMDYPSLAKDTPLPFIIKWNGHGFVVVSAIVQNQIAIGVDKETVTVSTSEFCKNWLPEGEMDGIVLLLEATPEFFNEPGEEDERQSGSFAWLYGYIKKYPRLVRQLAIGILIGTVLKLIPPFLTQSIVDVGINNSNLDFIYLILFAQLMLMVGRNSMEAIRGWLLLHVSTRVSISLLTDFIAKIMRLPMAFFSEKSLGDVMQRVEDQKRVEVFLSTQLSAILFSIVNIVIYTAIFAIYDGFIFGIFFGATLLYIGWIKLFMRKRRDLDSKRFEMASEERDKLVQIVQGMPDIKLANAEMPKRWDWEMLRAKLFRQNMRTLALSQTQQIGGLIINESKNIIITFLSAKAVLDGHLSIGAMLAIQQMLGQTNSPIEQLVTYMQQWQDARMSMERLNEVHKLPDEEANEQNKVHQLPEDRNLVLRNISFKYPNTNTKVLRDIKLFIPQGKTTAIIGSSGSGKTTLLKMLLKYHEPTSGETLLGNTDLRNISNHAWRGQCGVVGADGFVFSDTFLQNIALGAAELDFERVKMAARVANIHEHIEGLPMGYYTPISGESGGLSQGQKQRLLIARAVYKDPEYLFLDEGTNALDTQNQHIIMQNLRDYFKGRTMVVVAHRLSTIRHADQIVVIEKGSIVEKGSHEELIAIQGRYFELLTTQLEMAA
ncbi:MAG: peptidase domain-containing ABC transporter [Phycisphaerae bacterium]|nr:peptidase domain-containing ABC transporter [Saprospiraceae bacterium]